jgi:hypothetical protein
MLSFEEMQREMAEVRDRCLDLAAWHEQTSHGGRPCWPNRIGMVAFLAHALGMQLEHEEDFMAFLLENNARCRQQPCSQHTKGVDDAPAHG